LQKMNELHKSAQRSEHLERPPLGRDEWRAIIALLVLFIPTTLFWATYEQMGNTTILWIDTNVDRHIDLFGWAAQIPTTWFLAFNPFMIFAFTPFVVTLWTRQAARRTEPSTITKMALGLLWRHGGEPHQSLRRLSRRGRPSELAVGSRLDLDHHGGRALSLAGRPVACDQSGAGAHSVDDDGHMAGDEFHRRFSRRFYRQLLEPDGEAGILFTGRGNFSAGGRDHFRLPLAAQGNVAGVARHCEEPTGPARSGRPDDKLRDEAMQLGRAAWIASLRSQ